MGCIYQARNIINGKRYIGKSKSLIGVRQTYHESRARNGSKLYFHRALQKYGFNIFRWQILFINLRKKDLNIVERATIDLLDTQIPAGYNMTPGGDGGPTFCGRHHSAETKAKISKAKLGRKHTIETREKMSIARKGKPKSPEHIANMRIA